MVFHDDFSGVFEEMIQVIAHKTNHLGESGKKKGPKSFLMKVKSGINFVLLDLDTGRRGWIFYTVRYFAIHQIMPKVPK